MANERTEGIEPGPEERFKDFMYSGRDNYSGLDYDPKNQKVVAFRTALRAIRQIGRNHGLCEDETLILINTLYRRGAVWETLKWGEMEDVKAFVGNNADRIDYAFRIARGLHDAPAAAATQRTEW